MTGTGLVRILHYCRNRMLTNCQINYTRNRDISNLPIVSPPFSVCTQEGEVISGCQYAVPVITDILSESEYRCN